ncbi:MAG: hypothetical protein LBJ00_02910 [Planctomycetaceae bacterium]|nr:hypothetical protein [Planctomycetaceae bacterium]
MRKIGYIVTLGDYNKILPFDETPIVVWGVYAATGIGEAYQTKFNQNLN